MPLTLARLYAARLSALLCASPPQNASCVPALQIAAARPIVARAPGQARWQSARHDRPASRGLSTAPRGETTRTTGCYILPARSSPTVDAACPSAMLTRTRRSPTEAEARRFASAAGGGRDDVLNGGRRGGGGWTKSQRDVLTRIKNASGADEVLSVVKENLHDATPIVASAAVSKLGKMARSTPRTLAEDATFEAILDLVRGFALDRKLAARNVANTIHGIAKLGRAGWLKVSPGARCSRARATLDALERILPEAAVTMKPQEVSNTWYAYGLLRRRPKREAFATLQAATVRLAPVDDFSAQHLANILWSFATLRVMPNRAARVALDLAAERLAAVMTPQGVSNLVWSYATLQMLPSDGAWEAIEKAAVKTARDMSPQEVANTMHGYARLGKVPRGEAWTALESAAGQVTRRMNRQDLVTTIWSYDSFATLHGIQRPSCYLNMWDAVCGFKAKDVLTIGKTQLFHAYIMHHYLPDSAPSGVTYPPWLMTDGRDAWMRRARMHSDTSQSQRHVARAIENLGIKCQVEHLTDDGFFSLDIYLPKHDVAVEIDGISHHYHDDSFDEDAPALQQLSSTTRNMQTELRDCLLASKCAKVVIVPWFELIKLAPPTWDESCELTAYVKEKLVNEAGITTFGRSLRQASD